MANAKLYYDNLLLKYRESVTVTCTQPVVENFDLIYLNDKLASVICEIDVPAEDTGIIVFDFGAAVNCYGCVVINQNLTNFNQIKFMGNAADAWGAPTESEDLVLAEGVHAHWIIGATPWNFRYFALKSWCDVKMGQVFLLGAAPYTFTQNVIYKYQEPDPFLFEAGNNPTGEEASTLVHEAFKQRFFLKATAVAQKEILLEACRRRYVLWDIDGGGVTEMKYGRLQLTNDRVAREANLWSSEYLFTENPFTQVT